MTVASSAWKTRSGRHCWHTTKWVCRHPASYCNDFPIYRDYAQQFSAAYGDDDITMARIGQALASYQRTLIAADSPFDRWFFEGEDGALDEAAKRGFNLFTGKAGCNGCHLVARKRRCSPTAQCTIRALAMTEPWGSSRRR